MVSWIQCNHICYRICYRTSCTFPRLSTFSATGRRCDSTSQSPPGPETRDGHVQICWFQISNDPWFWKFRWFAGGDPKKMLSEMRQGSLELWGVNRNLKQGEKQKNKQEVFFWISLNTEYVVSALPRSALVLTIKAEHSAREIPISEQASAARIRRVLKLYTTWVFCQVPSMQNLSCLMWHSWFSTLQQEEESKFSFAAQPAFCSLFQDGSIFNSSENKKIKKHSSQKLLPCSHMLVPFGKMLRSIKRTGGALLRFHQRLQIEAHR